MNKIKSPAARQICGSYFLFSDDLIHVRADSDSLIVKGIVAVIVALFDKRTPQEICGAHIDFLEKTH